jgi:hypothetical protein
MDEKIEKAPAIAERKEDDRLPYEAPKFEVEQLFEVLALSCGKLVGNPHGSCRQNFRNS